jgi:hypothetical protein
MRPVDRELDTYDLTAESLTLSVTATLITTINTLISESVIGKLCVTDVVTWCDIGGLSRYLHGGTEKVTNFVLLVVELRIIIRQIL